MSDDDDAKSVELRKGAEERHSTSAPKPATTPQTYADAVKLVHELQIHQIEIEMQNEELQRTRGELESALTRYAKLYDDAPVGYLTLARDGTIEQVNASGARLLGEAIADLVGRRLGAFVGTSDLVSFNTALTKGFDGKSEESCEIALTTREESAPPRWARLTFAASDGAVSCRVIAADVTERRRVEEQLRALHKMEAVGRLAGGVAHDFNNLLMVIKSQASFAMSAAEGNPELIDDLRELQDAADQAFGLTRQLLSFGRKQRVITARLDVNKVILGTERIVRGLLGPGHQLMLDLGRDIDGVEMDASQLEQVIVNLSLNARDAMTSSGTLTIRTTKVDLDTPAAPSQKSGAFVLISFTDTGEGMDPTTLGQIFEPFFTTKSNGRGSGFGLSEVYAIVQQHSGEIAVRSTKGGGSTFDISFPRVAAPLLVPPAVEAKRAGANRSSETILVVDDEPGVRKATRRILMHEGYEVLEAPSAEDALRICEQHGGPIHLVVSDVVMPRMTGLELAVRLRKLRPDTRVLHMSGYADEALDKDGVISPARFISKPFTATTLAIKVREVLEASGSVAPPPDREP